LAVNPPTPVSAIEDCLDSCDMVLVMSVMPGFGGQPLDPEALAKLRQLRLLAGPDLALQIDGGINETTVGDCTASGANFLVIGSAIFDYDDYGRQIAQLNTLARSHDEVPGRPA
jgi:ribulose-phosphate 3-epimerase